MKLFSLLKFSWNMFCFLEPKTYLEEPLNTDRDAFWVNQSIGRGWEQPHLLIPEFKMWCRTKNCFCTGVRTKRGQMQLWFLSILHFLRSNFTIPVYHFVVESFGSGTGWRLYRFVKWSFCQIEKYENLGRPSAGIYHFVKWSFTREATVHRVRYPNWSGYEDHSHPEILG